MRTLYHENIRQLHAAFVAGCLMALIVEVFSSHTHPTILL
jgi:hypothetical protein